MNRSRVSLPLPYNTLLMWIKMRSQPGLLSTLAREVTLAVGSNEFKDAYLIKVARVRTDSSEINGTLFLSPTTPRLRKYHR